jgi:hypothetical protein
MLDTAPFAVARSTRIHLMGGVPPGLQAARGPSDTSEARRA